MEQTQGAVHREAWTPLPPAHSMSRGTGRMDLESEEMCTTVLKIKLYCLFVIFNVNINRKYIRDQIKEHQSDRSYL